MATDFKQTETKMIKLNEAQKQWLIEAVKGGATNYIIATELKVSKEQVKQLKKTYL